LFRFFLVGRRTWSQNSLICISSSLSLLALQSLTKKFFIQFVRIDIQTPFTVKPEQRSQPKRSRSFGQTVHIQRAYVFAGFFAVIGTVHFVVANKSVIRFAEIIERFGQLLAHRSRLHIREYTSDTTGHRSLLWTHRFGQ